jgi:competence protein ComFC
MIDRLLNIIAPHHCYDCRKTGGTLCNNCKYDIISEPFERCVNCLSLRTGNNGICVNCQTLYSRSWAVGERHDVLERLINGYKFSFEKESSKVLASLLNQTLPVLPDETVITYIPTVSSHIRQRGYDHARLIAREFAKIRRLPCRAALSRATNSKQVGASRSARVQQAKHAFAPHSVDTSKTYLVIDDIFTTGSTMKYASKVLLDAGAQDVYIAVIARQTLD